MWYLYFSRKQIAREVRKAWIHSKNYSAHKNSLTGSIGHTKTPTDAPQQNNDEYDHTGLSPNTTDRGPGYASVHLGNSGQDTSSLRINSTYDHLCRQPPQTHAASIYDHSSYKQNIAQTDDVIQTADDYDHIDRRVQKTKDSNDIYDHMQKNQDWYNKISIVEAAQNSLYTLLISIFLSCIRSFQNTIVSNIESWKLTN